MCEFLLTSPIAYQVQLSSKDGHVVLVIRNNGLPFPSMKDQRPGVGLRIMNYRANLVGASLDVKPSRSATVVTCSVPVHAAEERIQETGAPGPAIEDAQKD